MSILDIATVLRNGGLSVVELAGWQNRGENGPFEPIGELLHHDGMGLGWNDNPKDDMNVPEYMSQNGVDGSQVWVRKDGAWVIMAAGRKNHAGAGSYPGVPGSGNTYLLGIETDHTDGNPWPDVQMNSIYKGSKVLADHYHFDPNLCIGHLEWAPGRKHDPENFDLNKWRAFIAASTPIPDDGDDDMSFTDADRKVIKDLLVAVEKNTAVIRANNHSFVVGQDDMSDSLGVAFSRLAKGTLNQLEFVTTGTSKKK